MIKESTIGTGKPAASLYTPIENESEIRLLLLYPLVAEKTIRCTLHSGIVGQHAQYEALSYVWGSCDSMNIEINGLNIPIMVNLWNALYHLAPSSGNRTLWIDALCINQEDDLERNDQVTKMDKIYSQATNVVLWLGRSTSESHEMFNVLSDPEIWLNVIETPDLLQQCFDNIISICRREYWTRLWIVQEVILAQSITIQCGTDSCSWRRFKWFLETLGMICVANGPQMSLEDQSLNEINRSVMLRLMRQRDLNSRTSTSEEVFHEDLMQGTPFQWTGLGTGLPSRLPPLFSVWAQHKEGKCQNPRDKIFALRNLAATCCKRATPVDYTAPSRDILISVIQHHMDVKHSLMTTIPGTDIPRSTVMYTSSGNLSCEFSEAVWELQEQLQVPVKDRYCSENQRKGLIFLAQ